MADMIEQKISDPEPWTNKILCRYREAPPIKQFLREGEDRVLVAEITRLRQLLSEAEKGARREALGDAAEAIFVMGAWSPNYEKLVPNTFDEGTGAAYEVVRELQGKAEIPLQSEGGHVTDQ
ncbi:hypothetical protein ATN81_19215 [Agrobacterium pusense]|uniref:hypothetical protein n=1 Tax=Agrobacterium pusense TaxID=648995 RepID=UPI00092C53D2|nr:hypothetical protein [Agrobacterium pusense]OJH53240.1 hypothetical protein ATN81_19215 [Agrobacterium pusense]OJH57635.1 hypothetical protein BA725_21115 [Agrobacterium pusense]